MSVSTPPVWGNASVTPTIDATETTTGEETSPVVEDDTTDSKTSLADSAPATEATKTTDTTTTTDTTDATAATNTIDATAATETTDATAATDTTDATAATDTTDATETMRDATDTTDTSATADTTDTTTTADITETTATADTTTTTADTTDTTSHINNTTGNAVEADVGEPEQANTDMPKDAQEAAQEDVYSPLQVDTEAKEGDDEDGENHWSEPSSPKEPHADSGVKTTEDVDFSEPDIPSPPESPREQRKVSTVGEMNPSDETKTNEAWSAPVSDDDEEARETSDTDDLSKAEAVAAIGAADVGQSEVAADADEAVSDAKKGGNITDTTDTNATETESAVPESTLAGAALGIAAADAAEDTEDSKVDATQEEEEEAAKEDHIEEVAAVAAAAAAGGAVGVAIASGAQEPEIVESTTTTGATSVTETKPETDKKEDDTSALLPAAAGVAAVAAAADKDESEVEEFKTRTETAEMTAETDKTIVPLPAGTGVAAIAAAADKEAEDDAERRQSHGAQRAMALAGGKAAEGIKDEQIEGAAFKLDLPVEVPGDTDPEAYRKCTHLLNEARKKHTVQELHSVQLTGVLPMTKGLTEAMNKAHKRCGKLQARIEKDAATEEKDRLSEIATVEKRLTKELNFLHKTMSVDNNSKPLDERKTDDEIMMRARKLKWPHFSEFDRLIAHQHLEDMKYLYRLRLLYFISINETVHATEWTECDKIEAEEFASLHKLHAAEEKKLEKETHWGFTNKITGKKEINGEVVKKADYPQVVEEHKARLAENIKKETEEKKAMQAKRRVDLEAAQNAIISELISKQSSLLKNIKSDDRY